MNFKFCVLGCCLALASLLLSCRDVDADLRGMIPADADAVAVLNMGLLIEEMGMDAGELKLPQALRDAVGDNDDSPLCMALAKLPRLGLDTESHVYAFMPCKGSMRLVVLAALSDVESATATIQRMTGTDFTEGDDGIKTICTGGLVCAIKGKTLLAASLTRSGEAFTSPLKGAEQAVTEAADILNGAETKRRGRFAQDSPMSRVVANETSLAAACVKPTALNQMLAASDWYTRAVSVAPVIQLFTESDIDLIALDCQRRDGSIIASLDITARPESDYSRLMAKILSRPDANVLQTIPSTMDNIAMMSVHGDRLTDLPQVQQMLDMFKQQQYIGRMDLKPILATIDGPIACGFAADPHLYNVWNAVIAARSNAPGQVLQYISDFGSAYGQRPQQQDGELIYGWDNKMVSVGARGNIVYVKMLDYIQTEGPASDIAGLREAFAGAITACYTRVNTPDGSAGNIIFTMENHTKGLATFSPGTPDGNPTLQLMCLLASVRPTNRFSN